MSDEIAQAWVKELAMYEQIVHGKLGKSVEKRDVKQAATAILLTVTLPPAAFEAARFFVRVEAERRSLVGVPEGRREVAESVEILERLAPGRWADDPQELSQRLAGEPELLRALAKLVNALRGVS